MKNIILSVLNSFSDLATTGYGKFILIISAVFNFFQPEETSFYVVLGAVFADLFWGILAAKKCKKFLLSKAFRETVKKIGIYAFSMVGIYCIEKIIHEGDFVGIKLVATIAAGCELWSMSASMLIVKPDMPFLKIFRLQLKGEIESKIGKNIDHILKDETNNVNL